MSTYRYEHQAMTLRMPPEMHARIKREAAEQNTTMRALILARLEEER